MRKPTRLLVLALCVALPCCGGGRGATDPEGSDSESTVGRPVPNEGWTRVPDGTAVTYEHNPPASGTHYTSWLRYQEFTTAQPRGYWVHNLHHGAVVFLYRPDTPSASVTALRDVFLSLPRDPKCGHQRLIMMPDPVMPRPLAVVAADWILEGDTVDAQLIREFVNQRRGRAPEDVCPDMPQP